MYVLYAHTTVRVSGLDRATEPKENARRPIGMGVCQVYQQDKVNLKTRGFKLSSL